MSWWIITIQAYGETIETFRVQAEGPSEAAHIAEQKYPYFREDGGYLTVKEEK